MVASFVLLQLLFRIRDIHQIFPFTLYGKRGGSGDIEGTLPPRGKVPEGYWSPSAVIPAVPKLKMETALPTGDSKVLLSRQGINTPKSV